MISILGIGTYKPGLHLGAGVYSSLSEDYISQTSNSDVRQAIKNTSITTTEMGALAAKLAIERAGISADQIGLVLADCSTPVEIIPGESQRVACSLGLKVPAFDIAAGSLAFLNFMKALNAWKKEKLPEYILCLSVNSPTQRIDFSAGQESRYFSDGAGAVIVSNRHAGKLKFEETVDLGQGMKMGALKIDLFGHIKLDMAVLKENYGECKNLLNEYIMKKNIKARVISDSVPGCAPDEDLVNPMQANSLGSGIFFALAENWDNLSNGETLILFSTSLETKGGGFCVLRVSN